MGVRRGLTISALGVAGIAALVALTWPAAPFALAALASEKPPEILMDFDYPERMESAAFANRFKAGTGETELSNWLKRNGFEIVTQSSAKRRYEGVPCAYTYHVEWQSEGGILRRDATARFAGYGCL